jgi:immune inhibitor A
LINTQSTSELKKLFPSCFIPASPELEERILQTKKLVAAGDHVPEGGQVVDLRSFSLISQRPKNSIFLGPPSKIETTGTLKALVLLVDFDDNQGSTNKSHYEDLLFSVGTHSTGSMRDFFIESSYGSLNVVGEAHGWYRMPRPYTFYTDNQFGTGPYPKNTQKLVEDAVDAANADINYAEFDSDGDGLVDALFIVHAGTGAEMSGNTNHIWSHRWVINERTLDGVKIRDYTCEAEDGKIGLFCHELAHVWGIPDLYDTDYSSRGIGRWCLMAGGSWNGGGVSPAHPSAWVKKTLGWVDPMNMTTDQNGVSLADVESNAKILRLWTGGSSGKEYFLVENRQKKNFDKDLPSSGLAVWHIDENKSSNSDETHFLVAIEQADGKLDLEKNANSGDSGDLFRGSAGNSTFNVSSIPNSKSYGGADSKVSISNINDTLSTITFDIKVGAGAALGGWRFNCNITEVWATNAASWIYIGSPEPAGWRQLASSTVDMFNIALDAKSSGRLVNVFEDSSKMVIIIHLK